MSSNPRKINLGSFKIGLSRDITVTVKDRDTGEAIDITGDKMYFTVKNYPHEEDADAVLQTSVIGSGGDAVSGKAIIAVAADDTALVPANSYWYDIIWIRTVSYPGKRVPVKSGMVSFERAITHATS